MTPTPESSRLKMRACRRAGAPACMCAYMHVDLRACVRACMLRACMLRACVRACTCACVPCQWHWVILLFSLFLAAVMHFVVRGDETQTDLWSTDVPLTCDTTTCTRRMFALEVRPRHTIQNCFKCCWQSGATDIPGRRVPTAGVRHGCSHQCTRYAHAHSTHLDKKSKTATTPIRTQVCAPLEHSTQVQRRNSDGFWWLSISGCCRLALQPMHDFGPLQAGHSVACTQRRECSSGLSTTACRYRSAITAFQAAHGPPGFRVVGIEWLIMAVRVFGPVELLCQAVHSDGHV